MERVVTIHLNGVAFQLEEPGFEALKAYLDRAKAALADNPDRTEIIADLEQAIADKCAPYLRAGRNVVTAPEMATILEEMGPVDGGGPNDGDSGEADESASSSNNSDNGPRAPRRLYRIRATDDRMAITGVSAGLAAYADVDVNIVRAIWVVGALFTGGFLLIPYIVLVFVIPPAYTAEEVAAAHGAPFNAQSVIDEARRRFSEFEAKGGVRQWEWARNAERDLKEGRRAMREEFRRRRYERREAYAARPPVGYATQVIAGIFAVIFGLVSAALTIAFLIAVFSLATSGAVLGFSPPISAPIWVAIVVLIVIYAAVAMPLRAIRRASYGALSGSRHHYEDEGWSVLASLIVWGVIAWLAWHFVPGAREWMQSAFLWLQQVLTQIGVEVRT